MKKIQNQIKNAALALLLTAFGGTMYAQTVPEKDLKVNVVSITNSLEKLKNLTPVTYEYAGKYQHLYAEKGQQYGFLADNLQTVFPTMVSDKRVPYMFAKNQYRNLVVKSVDTESLIPVLVASIKELQAEIEKLKMELAKNKVSTNP
jgi:hypothetical protein